MHQNLTLDLTLTLWSGFWVLKQIDNYASCTDFYNPINKISIWNFFLCLKYNPLDSEFPWASESSNTPHHQGTFQRCERRKQIWYQGKTFVPGSLKPDHGNGRTETIWKISCWQESWKCLLFIDFPHISKLTESRGFHSTTHTDGLLLCAKPSTLPCRWKVRKTQSLITNTVYQNPPTQKQSSERQS